LDIFILLRKIYFLQQQMSPPSSSYAYAYTAASEAATEKRTKCQDNAAKYAEWHRRMEAIQHRARNYEYVRLSGFAASEK
jgi:hypothetical protein